MIRDYNPDLALIETSTPSIETDLYIARRIKVENNIPVALSGPHVSIFGKEILRKNPFVDYILVGEYEETLLELTERLSRKEKIDGVLGLIYRSKSQILANPRRPLIDLDKLPLPARHLLPIKNYRDSFCQIPLPSLYIWTTRGCPYRCIFCVWPEVMYGGHQYRVRSPVKVIDEIEHDVERFGFKSIYFDDDVFNLDRKRAIEISRLIKERGLNIPWAVMARADTMDYETLEKMASAGLFAIKYGIESCDQRILTSSGKNLDLLKVEDIIKKTKELGIRVHLTFVFGLPGETAETIERTIEYALRLDPYSIQFSIATPFPGTKYFRLAKDKGLLLSENWADYDGLSKAVIRTEELSGQDLEIACRKAYHRWYRHLLIRHPLRWGYIKEGLLHPGKIFSIIRKAFNL
jgi:radical SAM superfamily enzyme YgiQ (UPF0313 family)